MKIIATGCAGFIGSSYVRYMLRTHPHDEILTLDKLTYAGNLENLKPVENNPRHRFVKGDICDRDLVDKLCLEFKPDAIVNFAAETHVDRSLHVGADVFILTNVLGTQVLLDAMRQHGVKRYLQVSTDEVYGSLGPTGAFTETMPLEPNNPYSASKAAADCVVRAAQHSFGVDAVITRCSNNYGPCQFPEKLIPLLIANALENKPIPVYGDGMQVRDWIYCDDHSRAIDMVLRAGITGEVYNIGSMNDMPNLQLIKILLGILGKPESLITFVKDRPGHDRRYAMDATKIKKDLGWEPLVQFAQGMQMTVDWYLNNRDWLADVRSGVYQTYYQKLYGNRAQL